jgi:hypothetical protein
MPAAGSVRTAIRAPRHAGSLVAPATPVNNRFLDGARPTPVRDTPASTAHGILHHGGNGLLLERVQKLRVLLEVMGLETALARRETLRLRAENAELKRRLAEGDRARA